MSTLIPIDHFIICKDKHYNSFPNIVKRSDGTYYLGFRQAKSYIPKFGKAQHTDPKSRAMYMTSADGLTWDSTAQHILHDDFLYGVQDPCITVLNDGSLLSTVFLWKIFDPDSGVTGRLVYDYWIAVADRSYAIRSIDGGVTWDEPTPLRAGALRGNCIQLADGSILVANYTGGIRINKSTDGGITWSEIALIPNYNGYSLSEPNLYRTVSGKIVCFSRSSKGTANTDNPLVTIESLDGGMTWGTPVLSTTINNPNPYGLLRLNDGNILLTYGYRRKPYGIRARVLNAECTDIDTAKEVILRDDAYGADIGYTSAVQLDDDRILVVYYFYDEVRGPRYIAGTVCKLV